MERRRRGGGGEDDENGEKEEEEKKEKKEGRRGRRRRKDEGEEKEEAKTRLSLRYFTPYIFVGTATYSHAELCVFRCRARTDFDIPHIPLIPQYRVLQFKTSSSYNTGYYRIAQDLCSYYTRFSSLVKISSFSRHRHTFTREAMCVQVSGADRFRHSPHSSRHGGDSYTGYCGR
ncbi:hypothetical protein M8J76_010471 [Diaphorina citri]|nr:hypothetical protein M8J76_010471 [Diaphorina citri]